jgi:predicted AAA+ superfamily ATPase
MGDNAAKGKPMTTGPDPAAATVALLERIADALDRLAPLSAVEATPFSAPVLRWTGRHLVHVPAPEPLPLALFRGVDQQMCALSANLSALGAGAAAHDMLLWGARGMGKSALVRSVAHAVGLALVEASADQLEGLGDLFERLSPDGRPALVFIDDLAFPTESGGLRTLRSLLDGGVRARPPQIRLAVTSNHRHLLAREAGETATVRHPRDHAEDQLALVDRFGLVLGFHLVDQATYLAMCRAYLDAEGLALDEADALAFALDRGTRSGRTAWHYRVECLLRSNDGFGS